MKSTKELSVIIHTLGGSLCTSEESWNVTGTDLLAVFWFGHDKKVCASYEEEITLPEAIELENKMVALGFDYAVIGHPLGGINSDNTHRTFLHFWKTDATPKRTPKATDYQKWDAGVHGYTQQGSFTASLFKAYQCASGDNRAKLESSFPQWFIERK